MDVFHLRSPSRIGGSRELLLYFSFEKAPEPRTIPFLYGEPMDRGARNPNDILLCGWDAILFCQYTPADSGDSTFASLI